MILPNWCTDNLIIQWRLNPEMNTKLLLLVLAVAASLITACSGVMDSAQPARQYYMLQPLSGLSVADSVGENPSLSMHLGAVPGLDSDWIQALGSNAQLTRYANARWPDSLPEVLGSVIQRSLASTGRFASVDLASHASGGAWFLQLEVQKFYGRQDAAGKTTSVSVGLSGSIECGERRESFTAEKSVPVGAERLSTVVAAHQQGLDDVTRQLLNRITETCQ